MSVINNLPQGGGGNIIKDLAKMSTFTRSPISYTQYGSPSYQTMLSDGTPIFVANSKLYVGSTEFEAATEIADYTSSGLYMVETDNYVLFGYALVSGLVYCYNKNTRTAQTVTYSYSGTGTFYSFYPTKAIEDTGGIWVVAKGYWKKSSSSSSITGYFIGWYDISANTFTPLSPANFTVSGKTQTTPLYFSSVDNLLLAKTTTGVIAAGNGTYTLHIRRSDRAAVGVAASYSTGAVEVVAYGGGKYVVGGASGGYVVTVTANSNAIVKSDSSGISLPLFETANYRWYYRGDDTYAHHMNKSSGADEALSCGAQYAYTVDDGWMLYGGSDGVYFADKAAETVTQLSSTVISKTTYAPVFIKGKNGVGILCETLRAYYDATNHALAVSDDTSETTLPLFPGEYSGSISQDGQYFYTFSTPDRSVLRIIKHSLPDMATLATYDYGGDYSTGLPLDDGEGRIFIATAGNTFMVDTDGTAWRIFNGGWSESSYSAYRKGDIIVIRATSSSSSQTPTLLINTKTLKCSYDESGEVWTDAIVKQAELIYEYNA